MAADKLGCSAAPPWGVGVAHGGEAPAGGRNADVDQPATSASTTAAAVPADSAAVTTAAAEEREMKDTH